MIFIGRYILIPLTTNAIFLSDISETLISDSSNFSKNKMYLREFVSFRGYQDIRIIFYFLFLTVWTYFSSDFYQNFWIDSPQNMELESVEIFELSLPV